MKKIIFTILLMAFCGSTLLGQTKKTVRKQFHKKTKSQSKQQKAQEKKLPEESVLLKIDDEEYSLFAELWSDSGRYPNVIINETIPAQINTSNESKNDSREFFSGKVHFNYLKETMTDLSNEAIKNFNQKNNMAYLLEKKFPFRSDYELVSRDKISRFFYEAGNLEKGWTDFRKKYPKSGGYYAQFSRIGFSPDKKQAIIYFEYYCGSLCASGDYIFFVKEKDKWIEKGKVNLWVS